jgi:hypothetical protein
VRLIFVAATTALTMSSLITRASLAGCVLRGQMLECGPQVVKDWTGKLH